ncbi:Testis-specific chromodomain protein Y 2 [Holothuria leucospilota]|uniref:Testis-specific chromodomain protein Y 2 n=1 Tax=Holothuria leucospilota TaxID=206669 RepID=A0A9Q1CB56_HOLLE|nr:Testis-specific chromodomain protein Y 2 [Holothuria leucospilota]
MENEFEVEKILGKRTRNGIVKYKIRWKGFDETEDTWEPEENLTHCQELLDIYNSEKERDMTIIDQTIRERFPHASKESSVLSSPKYTSTPAPRAVKNDIKPVKRPERLLKEPDLTNSFSPRINKENNSEFTYTEWEDEPYSRWPLIILAVLVIVLILLVTPVGEFT